MAAHQTQAPRLPPDSHDEYIGDRVIAVATVFIVLEVVCVGLRFWARKIGKVAWGADDSLMIPSVIACLGLISGCLVDVNYGGVGHHMTTLAVIDPSTFNIRGKIGFILYMLYLLAVVLPKLAILVLFLRILNKRRDRVICRVLAVLMIANFLVMVTTGFLICVPLKFYWDRSIPGGHCLDLNTLVRWCSFMNIITDLIMIILPQPVIWKLKTTTKVKIGLSITFFTASIGLIASIIRFRVFFSADPSKDSSWSDTSLFLLTIIETGIYLIAAYLPTYRPLAIYIWRKAPFSTAHPGSGPAEGKRLESTHGAYEIPQILKNKSSAQLDQAETGDSSPC